MELYTATSQQAAAASRGIVLVPFGSMEQHCDAPLGTDGIIVWEVARRACTIIEEALPCALHPLIPVGYSPEWTGSPGTVSLGLSTFSMLVHDILESLHRSGFRRIALVNGHGGNSGLLEAAARGWASERRDSLVIVVDYWRPLGARIGHCDSVEKALLLEAGYRADCACPRTVATVEAARAVRIPPDPSGYGMPGRAGPGEPPSIDTTARRLAQTILEAARHRGGMML